MMDKRGLLLHSQLWKAVFKYLKHYMKILDFLYKATPCLGLPRFMAEQLQGTHKHITAIKEPGGQPLIDSLYNALAKSFSATRGTQTARKSMAHN